VIYDVRSKQNEANSALLGFAIFNNHAIAANILATAGAARGAEKTWTEGEKLTHDVDRASLGGLYGEFLLTQKLIREEYRGVYTEEQWIAGRRSFLQSLLANRPIFKSSAGQYLWEKDAVSNIEAALAAIADQ
jgi:predicted metal-dependent HD superfamily phosphohydrolase